MSLLKRRTIRVEGLTCSECEQQLEDTIAQLEGIQTVQADAESGTVTVSYDLLKTSLSAIVEHLREGGFALSAGLWKQFKRAWISYAEENERENFVAKPAPCCSDGDAIRARSGRIKSNVSS